MTDYREFDRLKATMEPLETWFRPEGIHRLLAVLGASLPLEEALLQRMVAIFVRYGRWQEAQFEGRWDCLNTAAEHLEAMELRLEQRGVDHAMVRCAAADFRACAWGWVDHEYARLSATHCPHCGTPRDPAAPRRTRPLNECDFPDILDP